MFDILALAEAVVGWRATLGEVGGASDGLDDAGRIDLIRALEELTCAATAAQAAVTVALDRSQRAIQADGGVPAAQRGRGLAPDAMTWLTALLPVKDGVGIYAALTRAADTARADGDPRTRGQVMADTLAGSALGAAARCDEAATRWAQAAADESDTAAGPRATLGLVMSDSALFGTSDEPAHIDGYGPIPAELAREIVAGAVLADETVWLRRLYSSPTTGQLVAMDSRARLFRGSLARFIRFRDQVCRTPWCDAPIRHTDHAESVHEQGETRADNGQGLCEACNHAKQAPGWRARASPSDDDHQIDTTTPTGHTYRSRAPAIGAGRALRIDLTLAG